MISPYIFVKTTRPGRVSPANRFGLDYRAVAARLGTPVRPIIDAHLHVNGAEAAKIFKFIAPLFGVSRVYSQTRLDQAAAVRQVLGDVVRFVAIPNFMASDRKQAFGPGYLDAIKSYHGDHGSRMIKFWNAPRLRDLITGDDAMDYIPFDSPWRVKAAELAMSLGMMFQCHVADPDTWFKTKYVDSTKYGTKLGAYESLERMVDRFPAPWLVAHMGGWPEDLAFLTGLLERHDNLYLDASATKWIVREISRHSREAVLAFLTRWSGRVLFGSDIVTTDEHLTPPAGAAKAHPMGDLADSPEAAFDLYSSRYAALRAMWESSYVGESPIADPDLNMVNPELNSPMAAPLLRGFGLPAEVLRPFYGDAAEALFAKVGW